MAYWGRRRENEYIVRIDGLVSSIVENQLYELLSVIGNIINVEIQSDGTNSYALAKFGSDDCAEAAIRYFQGAVLKGSTLKLSRKTTVAPGSVVLVWASATPNKDKSSDPVYESLGMSESQLKGLFSSFGSIVRCEILSEGRLAEIAFRDREGARLAVDSMNGILLGVLRGEAVDRGNGGRLWVEFEKRTQLRKDPLILSVGQVEAALQSAEFYSPDQRTSRRRSPRRDYSRASPRYEPSSPQYTPSSPYFDAYRARSPSLVYPESPGSLDYGMTGRKRGYYSGRRYDEDYDGMPRKRRRRR